MHSKLDDIKIKMNFLSEETIDFRALVYTFLEHKLSVVLITTLIMALALIYTMLKTPIYEASTLIQLIGKNSNSLSSSLSQLNFGAEEMSPAGAQMALIKSRFILEPVVNELGLNIVAHPHHFPLIPTLFSKYKNERLSIAQLSDTSSTNGPLKLIVKDATHFQLLKKNKLLVEGVVGELISNPEKNITIQVAEIQASPGTEFVIERSSNLSTVNNLLKRLQVQELGNEGHTQTGILEISLRDPNPTRLVKILNSIAKTTEIKDAERKSLETRKTLEFLKQQQLPLVKASLEEAETAFNRYRATTGKLDITLETTQLMRELTDIKKQLVQIKIYKADLLRKYTEKNPIILGINNKINQIKEQKTALEKQVVTLPASDQIAVNLMRDAKVKGELYLILLNKIQEMEVVEAGTISDVRILSQAIMPDGPLPKNTSVTMLASLMLGLILSSLYIFARKAFFRSVRDPRWIEQHLNLTNLAIIPYSKQQSKNVSRFKIGKKNHLEILAEKHPRDLSIEALRSLRTSFQITQTAATNNIITITGISQSIGKSFISVNFAYLLADVGKRILLIDGDIRKGHLHDYFKHNRAPGLTEAVTGNARLENVIQKTSLPTLNFLPSGNYPLNPSELLMSQNFKDLILSISKHYDFIIIDTAPVLAVTDSTIISALASINFLVVGSDTHQPEEIMLAVRRLDNARVKLLGTIFNILKPETALYGNYQYNYYSNYEKIDNSHSNITKLG